MFVSPNLSLRVWNDLSDIYDHEQLGANFVKLDLHDHTPGKGVQIPTAGIQDGAVTDPKLASGFQVGTGRLTDGAVTNAKLGHDAVTSDKILDGTIASADIANGAVINNKIQNAPTFSGNTTITGNASIGGTTTSTGNLTAPNILYSADSAKTWRLYGPIQWGPITLGSGDTFATGTITHNLNISGHQMFMGYWDADSPANYNGEITWFAGNRQANSVDLSAQSHTPGGGVTFILKLLVFAYTP